MSSNKNHIDPESFRRYLANEMSDAERNDFEKALQKYPFEAEALEGFEAVSSSDLSADLQEFRNGIQQKKQKSRRSYFAAAASILLLVSAGVIWMQLSRETPIPEVTENKTIEKEITKPRPKQETSEEDYSVILSPAKQESNKKEDRKKEEPPVVNKLELTMVDDNIEVEQRQETGLNEQSPTQIEEVVEDVNFIDEMAENKDRTASVTEPDIARTKSMPLQALESSPAPKTVSSKQKRTDITVPKENVIRGQVLCNSDGLPLPGVNIVEKGTTNGTITDIDGHFELTIENDSNPVVAHFIGMESQEFKGDQKTDNIITLKAQELALDEVVVIGYGTQKKQTITGSTTELNETNNYATPKPDVGLTKYKKYLRENAILPADFQENKVVIKIMLHISNSGKITKIENINNADSLIYDMAQKIVNEGPTWLPATENNQAISSEVKLRIVFKIKQ